MRSITDVKPMLSVLVLNDKKCYSKISKTLYIAKGLSFSNGLQ